MNEDHQPYIEKCFYLNKLQIQKYNDPMLQGKHMATLIFFSFSMILFIILFRDMKSYGDSRKIFIYHTIILEPIFLKMVIPIIYLIIKKDFLKFFCTHTGINWVFENIRINVRCFQIMNDRSMVAPNEIKMNDFNLAENRMEILNETSNDISSRQNETNADEPNNENTDE